MTFNMVHGSDRMSRPSARSESGSPSCPEALAMRVVLASSSPQRREILQKLGIDFEVMVPGVDELTWGDPEVEVVENARMKARAVEVRPDVLVIACDTDVVLDGKALGKP